MSFLYRCRQRIDQLLLPWYQRYPRLHRWRLGVAYAKAVVLQKKQDLWQSSQNLPALQALAQRRFDDYACSSAQPVPAPVGAWPTIDITLVTFNSSQWLIGFVRSLVAQAYPLQQLRLYWVDHGSADNTVAQLEQLAQQYAHHFGEWQLIEQSNQGFGAGHHKAITQGSSPYCLVTNVDVEFDHHALTQVVRMALADTQAEVASWELRQLPYEHPKYYDPVTLECSWSAYACVLIRRAAYEQVGGFEPQLFMYCEDVELSYRFRAAGFRLKYVPQATVHHYSYTQPHEVKPLQLKGGIEGSLCLRWRYGRRSDVWKGYALMLRLLLRPPAVEGGRALVWQAIKAAWAKRAAFQPIRVTAPMSVYFPFNGLDYGLQRAGAFVEAGGTPAETPLVSIITRTYAGRGVLLAQAIRSVLNQSYSPIELIVVEDGGSTLQAVVQQLSQQVDPQRGSRVRFMAHPKAGRSATGNAALAAATGQWLLFLDDDDLLFADHVEALVQAATYNADAAPAAAYALAFEVHTQMATDQRHYTEQRFTQPPVFAQPWDYTVLQKHNFMPIQSVLFHRRLYEEHGGFDSHLDQLEDWDLWLRYGQGQTFVYVPKTTSLFRSPASYTVRTQRALALHESYQVVRSKKA